MSGIGAARTLAAVCVLGVVALVSTTTHVLVRAQAPLPVDARVTDRVAALEREAAQLATQSRTLIGEVRKLEIERDLRTEQARQAERAAAAVRRQVADTTRRLEALESERGQGLPQLQAQFVDLYKRGRRGSWALLLTADGLREFARASRAATALAYRRQRVVADYQRTLEGLRAERDELAIRSRELRGEEARAALARQTADRAVAARATLLDDIDARRDLAAQYLSELQEAYTRVSPDVATRASSGVVETVAIPLGPFRGALQWPTPGRLTGRFAQPGPTPGSVRNGVEVAATLGAPVRAVHDGVVDYAEGYTGLGTLVILNHGTNNFSLYGHLAEALVKRGESVRAGAEVGRVGPGPLDGQPMLYFELRIDGRLVDPVQWLQAR